MRSAQIKNKSNRYKLNLLEIEKNVYKSVSKNKKARMSQLFVSQGRLMSQDKNSSISHLKNRCICSNRSRAIYRKEGLSRIVFKRMALEGFLPGVQKYSW